MQFSLRRQLSHFTRTVISKFAFKYQNLHKAFLIHAISFSLFGGSIFRILRKCKSVFHNNVSLTGDGLEHILLRHPELKRIPNLENEIVKTINTPEYIVQGLHGEHIAIRNIGTTPYGPKHLIVPYDEAGEVRTAFITSDVDRILKRRVLWRQL